MAVVVGEELLEVGPSHIRQYVRPLGVVAHLVVLGLACRCPTPTLPGFGEA